MALGTPSESPAVVVKEIDLTGGVPNVQSTTGAIVGNFRWGPVEERTLVNNEATLVDTFANPDSDTTVDFHSAAYFLRYTSSLQVVREVTSAAKNSRSTVGQLKTDSDGTLATTIVKNEIDFNSQKSSLSAASHTFVAKYPGELGNSLKVSLLASDSANGVTFANWTYADEFDKAPGTSVYATGRGASRDEVHVAVIDSSGEFTGTAGTILETFPFLSLADDAKNTDGTTNYIEDVINERSEYIWMVGFDSDYNVAGAGTTSSNGKSYAVNTTTLASDYPMAQGVNSSPLTTSEILTGFDLFEDRDQVEVDFLIAPGMNARVDQTTVVNDLVATASSLRKDCIVVASPARTDVVNVTNAATATTNVIATGNTFTNSSYLVMDNNYLKVYDKYNDQYIYIPAASSIAGLCAATDINRGPWFSPAGIRRGNLLGITALAWTPNKSQRDQLYKADINPIANIPGQGTLLYGDKTMLGRPSAFDRVNVRRLFLVLERAIARAAQSSLFEFNDEFTRAEFVNIVEPVLREVKGRRGITDFRVVCDETNNTPAIIDRNEFIANIFIKPARSINYITLNFVAVRTGVDFEEVVGTV
ncbi:phage tail sheath subtilisin-like domain-containing protein [bacterium]|jgi:hypothetical protein|nr:phage tail sheath subtilisin-like domain-containing protein [bacterium]